MGCRGRARIHRTQDGARPERITGRRDDVRCGAQDQSGQNGHLKSYADTAAEEGGTAFGRTPFWRFSIGDDDGLEGRSFQSR